MKQKSQIGLIIGLAAAVAWAVFGLSLAFGSNSALLNPLMTQLLQPFYGSQIPDATTLRLLGFVYGVLGAVMLSWSLLFAVLFWHAHKQQLAWAWWAAIVSVLAWFGLDESFSLYFGVNLNALGNLLLLAWFGLALALTAPRRPGAAA